MHKAKVYLGLGLTVVMLLNWSCKKEEEYINPYDDSSLLAPAPYTNTSTIDVDNFAYLQANIFSPTCAVSGCHDGTFPPDFRTINSSYNTLVYQKPVNDNSGMFRYRVMPGNADSSILHFRMTVPIGSGIMPIIVDSVNAVWAANSDGYIALIKDWINNGAKDMYGNSPQVGNAQPTISGFLAYPAGNTSSPYPRASGNIAPILVPANSSIDLWFLVGDNETPLASFNNDTCKVSKSIFSFDNASSSIISYNAVPLAANDFSGASGQYYHKTISTDGYIPGDHLYVRASIDDGSQAVKTEIPNDGTSDIIRGYFTLKIQ